MEDMLESPEIDVEKIMEQIRENARKHRQGFSPSDAASPLPTDQVAVDLTFLHRDYDIYSIHFTSHRRGLGRFVVLIKKLLQQLLTPILERQSAYNAANTRVTSYLWDQAEKLRQRQAHALQALQEQMEGVQQQQAAVQAKVVALGHQQVAMQAAVEALGQQQADALQALRTEVAAQVVGVQQ